MNCYICNHNSFIKRPGSVRDNKNLEILECENCELVFLSSMSHIDDKFYSESGMHGAELLPIQAWLNETEIDDERRFQFLKQKIINKKLLDFGCGVGGFLLKSRNIANLCEGLELEKRLQGHFQNHKLQVWTDLESLVENESKYDIITAFHVIEHLADPISILERLSSLLTEGGEMILEIPSSNDALLSLYKSESFSNFTYWSNHLYLFNNSTFQKMIWKTGLKLNWMKQIQRYPLSNHLYWLSKGKPGGHQVWSFLNNDQLNAEYEMALASAGLCDTIIASVSNQ